MFGQLAVIEQIGKRSQAPLEQFVAAAASGL